MARPPYKPTPALRRKVSIAAGGGMAHEEIALALGISQPTLRKHFEIELSTGAFERRLEIVAAMHKAAKAGSVSAARAYMQLTPHLAAPPVAPAERAEKAAPALGKKEQANVEARTAHVGTEWADLLRPQAAPVQ